MVKLLAGHLKVCAHTLTGLGRFFFSLCILYQAYDMLTTKSTLDDEYDYFSKFMKKVMGN
jgi:nicotinamide riboside transporter PnuC